MRKRRDFFLINVTKYRRQLLREFLDLLSFEFKEKKNLAYSRLKKTLKSKVRRKKFCFCCLRR